MTSNEDYQVLLWALWRPSGASFRLLPRLHVGPGNLHAHCSPTQFFSVLRISSIYSIVPWLSLWLDPSQLPRLNFTLRISLRTSLITVSKGNASFFALTRSFNITLISSPHSLILVFIHLFTVSISNEMSAWRGQGIVFFTHCSARTSS